MKIDIKSRLEEAVKKINEYTAEAQDYNNLLVGFNALKIVAETQVDDKVEYTKEEYDLLISTIRRMCAKHEILLPEYIEWNNIEII